MAFRPSGWSWAISHRVLKAPVLWKATSSQIPDVRTRMSLETVDHPTRAIDKIVCVCACARSRYCQECVDFCIFAVRWSAVVMKGPGCSRPLPERLGDCGPARRPGFIRRLPASRPGQPCLLRGGHLEASARAGRGSLLPLPFSSGLQGAERGSSPPRAHADRPPVLHRLRRPFYSNLKFGTRVP